MGRQISHHSPLVLLLVTIALLIFEITVVPNASQHGLANTQQSLGEDAITFCPDTRVITHGSGNINRIALTFDADMTFGMDRDLHIGAVKSYINRDLINTLINTNTKSTLFLTGLWIRDYLQETKSLAQNPLFELANHSFSHPSFSGYCYGLPQLGILTMKEEILETQALLKSITGVDNTYFRFPGGCISSEAMDFLSSQGIQVVHWDTVGEDGFNDSTQSIIRNVVDNVHNGSIIVLHMNGYPNDPKTSEALPTIISQLKARGYEFVTVSELLN